MHPLPQAFLSTTWVKMFDISDSELIMLYRENNEEALELIVKAIKNLATHLVLMSLLL